MRGSLLLQNYTDQLANGEIFRTVVDVFTSALPLPMVAALFFLPVGAAFYVVQRSAIIPFVMVILLGGSTVALAPPAYSAALVGLLVLVLGGGVYVLLQRLSVTQ